MISNVCDDVVRLDPCGLRGAALDQRLHEYARVTRQPEIGADRFGHRYDLDPKEPRATQLLSVCGRRIAANEHRRRDVKEVQ